MSIRRKILVYFSSTVITLAGGALFFIYTLFSEHREEQFQQRQKEKIASTLMLLSEIKDWDEKIFEALDNSTIHDFYDEKLMIFNSEKRQVYKSVDDLSIEKLDDILAHLSDENEWIETKEGLYDVVGTVMRSDKNLFYGISKAYDRFGYEKLRYLGTVLLATFFVISLLVFLVSQYLAEKIAGPLTDMADTIEKYDFRKDSAPLQVQEGTREISILAHRFNEMMERMNKAFSFQKHAVQHISHELKTPVSVLVSNFENIEQETDMRALKRMILRQKEDTRSLSEIINALLEISKAETHQELSATERVRVDELVFDIADELRILYPDFSFSIEYGQVTEDERGLSVHANLRLLKMALSNLMLNTIQYSSDQKGNILFDSGPDMLEVRISNNGEIIHEDERPFLFQYFFRGANSRGKRGFGLGLVLIHKILQLHRGDISYYASTDHTNTFVISLPLN